MPGHPLHTLVTTLRRRPGVEAALVVSVDGLVISQEAADGVAVEALAAQAPRLLAPAAAVGTLAGRGPLQLAFLDHETGSLVLAPLSDEAALLVVTSPACDRAGLVSDLRRHRLHLVALA